MEKRFPPSAKKLKDLRKKGDVHKSVDLPGSAVLVTATIVATLGAMGIWKALGSLVELGLEIAFYDMGYASLERLLVLLSPYLVVPVLIAGIIGTIVAFMVVGPVFSGEAISPKFERLNPANGVKKLFSGQQLVVAGKGLVAIAVLLIAFFLLIRYEIVQISRMPFMVPAVASQKGANMILTAMIVSSVMGVVIALAESSLSKFLFIKKNMMTREEVEREHKEQEGNPHIKAKRRQIALEELENDAVRNTSDAELLIVNPTHIAIAVKGESKLRNTPIVVAKGRGLTAARMREKAQKEGIPIVRNRQLARNLFVDAKIRAVIPNKYIDAVSQALSWVRRMETFKKQQKEREAKGE
jgi:type III secretion protein U